MGLLWSSSRFYYIVQFIVPSHKKSCLEVIYIIKQKTLQCYRENKCLVLVGRTNSLYTGKDFHQNQTSWMGRNLLWLVSEGVETEDRKRSMEKQWTITRTKHRMQKAKLTYLSLEDCTVHCNGSIAVGWGFGSAAGEGCSRGFRGSTRRGWLVHLSAII